MDGLGAGVTGCLETVLPPAGGAICCPVEAGTLVVGAGGRAVLWTGGGGAVVVIGGLLGRPGGRLTGATVVGRTYVLGLVVLCFGGLTGSTC